MSKDVVDELRSELRSLTLPELSQATGIAAWRIRELIAKGAAPPHFKLGRVYRFPIPAVREWFAGLSAKKEARS